MRQAYIIQSPPTLVTSRAQLHSPYLLPSQQMGVNHLQMHPDHYSGQVCLILEIADQHIIVLASGYQNSDRF